MIEALDILAVWGLALLGYFCRVFVLRPRPFPVDAFGWIRFLSSFMLIAGAIVLQEHFRGKNRAARLRNLPRRAIIALIVGLGGSIGG
jgi:hypothetical protein